jgi:hypothetical protein
VERGRRTRRKRERGKGKLKNNKHVRSRNSQMITRHCLHRKEEHAHPQSKKIKTRTGIKEK